MATSVDRHDQLEVKVGVNSGGIPVRTNLRAGLTVDDLDDRGKALWGKLTSVLSAVLPTATTPAA